MYKIFAFLLLYAILFSLHFENLEKIIRKPGVQMFHKDMRVRHSNLPLDNEFVAMGIYLYGVSPQVRDNKRDKLYKRSKKIFLNLENESANRIPHISHRIWLTHSDEPYEAPKDRLELYIQSLKKLDKNQNWKHLFWCLDKKKIPNTVQFIENSGLSIEIHEMQEIYAQMRGKHIFKAFYEHKLFALAADVLRQNIIYLFGGIYSDIGVIFKDDLTPYLDAYDYIFNSASDYIDQSFFGYKKHDPIFNIFLNNLNSLYKFPDSIKNMPLYHYPEGIRLVTWVGPAHLTAVFDKYCQETDRVLFAPNDENILMQLTNLNSWVVGTHGSKSLYQSKLNIFTILP